MAIRALDEDDSPESPLSKTLMVLGLLVLASLLLSYLAAYAFTGVLVAADFIRQWPADQDPRPQWMLRLFISLLAGMVVLFGIFRWLSYRQLQRIDAMAEDEQ